MVRRLRHQPRRLGDGCLDRPAARDAPIREVLQFELGRRRVRERLLRRQGPRPPQRDTRRRHGDAGDDPHVQVRRYAVSGLEPQPSRPAPALLLSHASGPHAGTEEGIARDCSYSYGSNHGAGCDGAAPYGDSYSYSYDGGYNVINYTHPGMEIKRCRMEPNVAGRLFYPQECHFDDSLVGMEPEIRRFPRAWLRTNTDCACTAPIEAVDSGPR